MGFAVDVAERGAALDPDSALCLIDMHPAHVRKVDDQSVVADCPAADIVATAAHRHDHVVRAGEIHRSDHVGDAMTAQDRAGMFVDEGVPDPPGVVEACVAGPQQGAACRFGEFRDLLFRHGDDGAVEQVCLGHLFFPPDAPGVSSS